MSRRGPGTIEQIEGVQQSDPGPDATTLVRRCLALRRKPLSEFTTEDLRIMLGQQLAVPILLPMAVAVLADNLWVPKNSAKPVTWRSVSRPGRPA